MSRKNLVTVVFVAVLVSGSVSFVVSHFADARLRKDLRLYLRANRGT